MDKKNQGNLEERYYAVRDQIAKLSQELNRRITLVAVSKTKSVEEIEAVYRLGQRDFGENYVQELLEKAEAFSDRGISDIRWHFIGHLQRNKVKPLVQVVAFVHSVDSVKLANEIGKRAETPIPILLEVNIDGEASKAGFHPAGLREAAQEVASISNIQLLGLMCIPKPAVDDKKSSFLRLAELKDQLGPLTQGLLSMGMSDDFESAIECGSDFVRVGSKIFGPRA